MTLKGYIVAGVMVLILSLAVSHVGFAHGTEKHKAGKEVAGHMKDMYALKDKIPEEYRIMKRTPIIPDKQSLRRGKEIYEQQCAGCHGNAGDGKGPQAAAMSTPPANFLDKKHSAIYGPGEKYWIIGNGSGNTGMPGFPQIDLLDRWHQVNYILHLQKEGATATEE